MPTTKRFPTAKKQKIKVYQLCVKSTSPLNLREIINDIRYKLMTLFMQKTIIITIMIIQYNLFIVGLKNS